MKSGASSALRKGRPGSLHSKSAPPAEPVVPKHTGRVIVFVRKARARASRATRLPRRRRLPRAAAKARARTRAARAATKSPERSTLPAGMICILSLGPTWPTGATLRECRRLSRWTPGLRRPLCRGPPLDGVAPPATLSSLLSWDGRRDRPAPGLVFYFFVSGGGFGVWVSYFLLPAGGFGNCQRRRVRIGA